MNNPASEQPSTRQVLLALGVVCVGLLLALIVSNQTVRSIPLPSIPTRNHPLGQSQSLISEQVWRLDHMLINWERQIYAEGSDFYIQFNSERNALRGHDGCNYFLYLAKQDALKGRLIITEDAHTLIACFWSLEWPSNDGFPLLGEKIDGVETVLPYVDFYILTDEKLILSSYLGQRQYIFFSAGIDTESEVDFFSWDEIEYLFRSSP